MNLHPTTFLLLLALFPVRFSISSVSLGRSRKPRLLDNQSILNCARYWIGCSIRRMEAKSRSTLTLLESRMNGRVTGWAVVGNRLRAVPSWELGTSLPNRRPIVVIKESRRRAMNRRLRPASRSRCVFERRSDADLSAVIGNLVVQAGERRSSLAQDTDPLRPRVQFAEQASGERARYDRGE
jgi:hypothetical protein